MEGGRGGGDLSNGEDSLMAGVRQRTVGERRDGEAAKQEVELGGGRCGGGGSGSASASVRRPRLYKEMRMGEPPSLMTALARPAAGGSE